MKLNTKLLLIILSTAIVIYAASIVYVSLQSKEMALQNAMKITDAYAREYANKINATLSLDMGVARSLAQTFTGYEKLEYEERRRLYINALINILEANKQYIAVWTSWELSAIDSTYTKSHGRERAQVYYVNQHLNLEIDTLDYENPNVQSLYYRIKSLPEEYITDPYFYSYADKTKKNVLETSVCVPIMRKEIFVGLAGMDVELSRFQEITDKIRPYLGSFAFLIANDGQFISHPIKDYIGKNYAIVEPANNQRHQVIKSIQAGLSFSFLEQSSSNQSTYTSFAPIRVGNALNKLSLGISVPVDVIMQDASRSFSYSIVVGLVGMVVLTIIIILLTRNITQPLRNTTEVLSNLAKGQIDRSKKLKVKSSDEIGEMSDSLNKLIDGLNSTAHFAKEIGQGNIDAQYNLLSEHDTLGNSLLEMRESLKRAHEEDRKRKVEDEKLNWATQGYAKFGEILRSYDDDLKEFSYNLISNMVKFIHANQGGLFFVNDENQNDIFIELLASIAYDKRKNFHRRFEVGEGLVGRCVRESKTILLTKLPDDYILLTSGMGYGSPTNLVIVPLLFNNKVYGAIELASFKQFLPHQIQFIEQVGNSFAITFANIKNSIHTAKLYEATKLQSEELAIKERELLSNLQELKNAQEQMERIKKDDEERTLMMMHTIEEHKDTLARILDEVSERVFLKDSESRMVLVNSAVAKYHKMKSKEMFGKSDFDFFEADIAKNLYNEEQEILRTNQGKTIRHEETKDGITTVVLTRKIPFQISYLQELGILGIQSDITELERIQEVIKIKDNEIALLKEKMNKEIKS